MHYYYSIEGIFGIASMSLLNPKVSKSVAYANFSSPDKIRNRSWWRWYYIFNILTELDQNQPPCKLHLQNIPQQCFPWNHTASIYNKRILWKIYISIQLSTMLLLLILKSIKLLTWMNKIRPFCKTDHNLALVKKKIMKLILYVKSH